MKMKKVVATVMLLGTLSATSAAIARPRHMPPPPPPHHRNWDIPSGGMGCRYPGIRGPQRRAQFGRPQMESRWEYRSRNYEE